MRTCFALVIALVAACGGNGGSGPGGDDDATPDAPTEPPPPANGFRIKSKEIQIQPGEEVTYCYYFRTPNTKPMAINHWKSSMTPGSHHMIMFLTQNDAGTPDTVSSQDCGLNAAGGGAAWTYAAQMPDAEVALPSDDGTGKPLAQEIAPNTPGFFQMHYLNASDQVLTVSVTLDASALDDGAPYTKTAAYVTYNAQISIPAGATNDVETMTCDVPAGAKFWLMSTHAHKQATLTQVKDGQAMVFESDDWEHPGAAAFMTPAEFYTFESGKLTYSCTYNNPTNRTITSGDSADTDEMCMASGYYFPATKPRFCVNNFLIP